MSFEIDSETLTVFEAKLQAAGIAPTGVDRDLMLGMFVYFRPLVDAMYDLPEARDELPALGFRADQF
jgi:hypothetical protein